MDAKRESHDHQRRERGEQSPRAGNDMHDRASETNEKEVFRTLSGF